VSSERIAVAHLVRKANDIRFLHAFLDAYRRLPAGRPHDLVLILKGFAPGEETVVAEAARGLAWTPLALPDTGRDVGSYLAAAKLLDQDLLCFINSFSRPLSADWLAKLHTALTVTPQAGVVGATGSWWRISRDHPFPNYNIRTNGFLIRRDLLMQLRLWEIKDRHDAVLFEAGPEGLTAQILARGLQPFVVDADGVVWPHERWPISRTFWSREQEGLLKAAGYVVIVATNQKDIETGKTKRETLDAMHDRLRAAVAVDDIRVCTCIDECPCYKPNPGMLLEAARDWNIDLSASVMIGDRWRDIGAGRNAGCVTVFIDRGYAEDTRFTPDLTATDLADAVDRLLGLQSTPHGSTK
jgi:D-glycero-D-manno-heptose 1,7-bisphosphate phosphatase